MEISRVSGHDLVSILSRVFPEAYNCARFEEHWAWARCVRDGRDYSTCVVNYHDQLTWNWKAFLDCPLVAASRGLVFRVYDDGDVKLLGFPFAKFFNAWQGPFPPCSYAEHVVAEKLDGTMISCWRDPDSGAVRCNTRGLLDNMVDVEGRVVVGENPLVARFYQAVRELGLWRELERLVDEYGTVVFELVGDVPASMCATGSSSRSVEMCYRNARPYLLAARRGKGPVVPSALIETSFPRPRTFVVDDFARFEREVEKWRESEGVVVYYPGRTYMEGIEWWDYALKMKSRTYITVTRLQLLKQGVETMKPRTLLLYVLRTGLSDAVDDLATIVPELPRALELVMELARLEGRDVVDVAQRAIPRKLQTWQEMIRHLEDVVERRRMRKTGRGGL